MRPTTDTEALRARRIGVAWKIAALPVFFLVVIAVLITLSVQAARNQQTDAAVTDVMARQRLLSGDLGKLLLLRLQGGEAAKAYDETAREFLETVAALLTGGETVQRLTGERVDLPPPPTEAIRRNFEAQRTEFAQLRAMADSLLAERGGDPALREHLAAFLEAQANLDTMINEGVKLFTAHSEDQIVAGTRRSVVLALLVGVLGVAFSWLLSRSIVRPLAEVVAGARSIMHGDLRAVRITARSSDEIGELAHAFSGMSRSLVDLVSQASSVSNDITAASSEILASTMQQATAAKEQASTIQEITTTMQELAQSGVQIGDRAKEVAASAEAASTSTEAGMRAVKEAAGGMDAIREQVEDVAENIVVLSEKTQTIGDIINTVTELAEQTNLLALNASIEAVSAGEKGDRFAVVAGEMKNLADQARGNTVEVRTILGEIQKGINKSVMLTEEAVKRVEEGKRRSDQTETTIALMGQATIESVHAFQQIAGGANQQRIGFDQVSQGMMEISKATEQTAIGTAQLERSAADLNALSHQLQSAIGRYTI
jgi:methyl-accepting chemotaxis protein